MDNASMSFNDHSLDEVNTKLVRVYPLNHRKVIKISVTVNSKSHFSNWNHCLYLDGQIHYATALCSQLAPGAQVLDLGCGPGFYTQLLAKRGFCCTGIDFSPASITYAQQQAQVAGLDIDYQLQDVRSYRPTKMFDFIMMTFGELNVFSAADAKSLLKHCANWLTPSGKLLVEVHSFDEVKRQGQAEPSWQRHSQGLFLDAPHLLLTEHAWDEALQISSTLFWVIEENGKVTRFGSRMQAWQDEEYLQLLNECGFNKIQRVDTAVWPSSNTFEGKLYTLMACYKA
ncbi:class I SAM-dependent methyltransferase [Shewanella algae]|uniref:class I SAM-dependent methyltransferase n=1 Tax=Shewanella algae TaxID=38313 RepID=UPI003005101E